MKPSKNSFGVFLKFDNGRIKIVISIISNINTTIFQKEVANVNNNNNNNNNDDDDDDDDDDDVDNNNNNNDNDNSSNNNSNNNNNNRTLTGYTIIYAKRNYYTLSSLDCKNVILQTILLSISLIKSMSPLKMITTHSQCS